MADMLLALAGLAGVLILTAGFIGAVMFIVVAVTKYQDREK